jgi:hypothetical protein
MATSVAEYPDVREIRLHGFELDQKTLEGSFRATFDGRECPHPLLLLQNPQGRLLAILPVEPYRHTELRNLVEISPEAHDALQRAIDDLLPSKRAQVVEPGFEYRIAVGPPQSLGCPECRRRFALRVLLLHSKTAWPNQRWILFTCPGCKGASHLFFDKRSVSIGRLEGAPGPGFVPSETMDCPRLSVIVTSAMIECVLGSGSYRFHASRGPSARKRRDKR